MPVKQPCRLWVKGATWSDQNWPYNHNSAKHNKNMWDKVYIVLGIMVSFDATPMPPTPAAILNPLAHDAHCLHCHPGMHADIDFHKHTVSWDGVHHKY